MTGSRTRISGSAPSAGQLGPQSGQPIAHSGLVRLKLGEMSLLRRYRSE